MMPAETDRDQSRFLREYMGAQAVLRAYVLSIVRDLHLAEDVLQETALAAWARFGQWDPERPFAAWAMGIARNKSVDALRARGARCPLPEDVLDRLAEDAGDLAPEAGERRQVLAQCLGKLNERARELLKLRFEEELGAEEIARRLGQSLAAVRKALCRTRAFLVNCTSRALGEGLSS